ATTPPAPAVLPPTASPSMLNYIWSGLIVSSLLFALWFDVGDLARDAYRNGEALPVEVVHPDDYDPAARVVPVSIRVDADAYRTFYGSDASPEAAYPGELLQTLSGRQLRFAAGADHPEPLATIQGMSSSQEGALQGPLVGFDPAAAAAVAEAACGADAPADAPAVDGAAGGMGAMDAAVRFEPVRFVK